MGIDATGAVSILALVLIIYMYTECSVDQRTNLARSQESTWTSTAAA